MQHIYKLIIMSTLTRPKNMQIYNKDIMRGYPLIDLIKRHISLNSSSSLTLFIPS